MSSIGAELGDEGTRVVGSVQCGLESTRSRERASLVIAGDECVVAALVDSNRQDFCRQVRDQPAEVCGEFQQGAVRAEAGQKAAAACAATAATSTSFLICGGAHRKISGEGSS